MSDYQQKFSHDGGDRFDRPMTGRRREPGPGARFVRWLAHIVGTALALVLAVVLLPYAFRWAAALIPDGSRNAINASVVISHELKQSARLETVQVDDEGVLNSTINAALIGQVQSVMIHYNYHASVGIDLTRVQVHTAGSQITLALPPLEVLSDSLDPIRIDTQDFWYPLTEERRIALLEKEKADRQTALLAEAAGSEEMWNDTVTALESTVGTWLSDSVRGVSIRIVPQEAANE